MMDISDGLLIDAARMAEASRVSGEIELQNIPLSEALLSTLPDERQTRIDAAIAGDDYELLFAAPPDRSEDIQAISATAGVPVTCIGRFAKGEGLSLTERGTPVPLPHRLGYEHGPAA